MKRVVVAGLAVVILAAGLVALALGIGLFLSPQSKLAPADAIVAISGGETDARVRQAVELYQAGYAPMLIFSGAALDTNGPSNARIMQRQAIAEGVNPSHILIDETATNTSENASAVAVLVRKDNFHSIILVTSPYHQRRASISFSRALGPTVTIINHSSIDLNWRRSRWWLNPSAYPITIQELQKTLFLLVTGRQ